MDIVPLHASSCSLYSLLVQSRPSKEGCFSSCFGHPLKALKWAGTEAPQSGSQSPVNVGAVASPDVPDQVDHVSPTLHNPWAVSQAPPPVPLDLSVPQLEQKAPSIARYVGSPETCCSFLTLAGIYVAFIQPHWVWMWMGQGGVGNLQFCGTFSAAQSKVFAQAVSDWEATHSLGQHRQGNNSVFDHAFSNIGGWELVERCTGQHLLSQSSSCNNHVTYTLHINQIFPPSLYHLAEQLQNLIGYNRNVTKLTVRAG